MGRQYVSLRGDVLTPPPLLSDPRDWLENRFDWDESATVVDLFAGAGGIGLGFDSVPGFQVVAAFERDPVACATYAANHWAAVVPGDISAVESFRAVLKAHGIRRVDLVVGGPPCQGFSRLGKGALRRLALEDGRGVDDTDPRNSLFRQFLRAVRELTPQVVVMENVPEMERYESIMLELDEVFEELGYKVDRRVLRADDYGVPQRRRRLIVVASRSGQTFRWPKKHPRTWTVRDAIADLPAVPHGHLVEEVRWCRPERPNAYLRRMRAGLAHGVRLKIRDHVTRSHRDEDLKAFRHMCEGDTYAAVPYRLRRYRDDIFADKYHRMIWDEPAWTVTAHLAKDGYKYIHPEQHRTLTVREAARLQSFPDVFRFAGYRTDRFRQVGNAVPPRLAEAVAAQVLPLVR